MRDHPETCLTSTSQHCPSDWLWAQLQMEMLPKQEAASLLAHIDGCASCQRRRRERRESEAYLAKRNPWEALLAQSQQAQAVQHPKAEQHPQEAQAPVHWRLSLFAWLRSLPLRHLALGGLAALLLPLLVIGDGQFTSNNPTKSGHFQQIQHVQVPGQPFVRHQQPGGQAKSKQPSLRMLHYHLGSRVSQWTPYGATLHPGDLVQFDYELPKPLHVMVISINQQGELSVYVPLGAQRSRQFTRRKGTYPASHSLELDEILGLERIFMVAAETPLTRKQLGKAILRAFHKARRRLDQMGTLQGPWFVQSTLINKRPRPQQKER